MDDAMTVEAARAYLDQVTTFEPPPPGFDPFRAKARELAAYGYPRRPDPKTETDLFMLWEKAFGSEHEFIRAELGVDEQLLKWRQQEEFGVGGWGGAVVEPSSYGLPASELANVAYAEWTLPGVSGDPAQPSTEMSVAFWVGVDGYILGRRQVVQGGVEAVVTGTGFARYVLWFEWYPAPPVGIFNLDVRNGSRLAVLLCTPTADRGFLSISEQGHRGSHQRRLPSAAGLHVGRDLSRVGRRSSRSGRRSSASGFPQRYLSKRNGGNKESFYGLVESEHDGDHWLDQRPNPYERRFR